MLQDHGDNLVTSNDFDEDESTCFPEKCAFEAAFTEIDMMHIEEKYLTVKAQSMLNDIRSDIQSYSDVILDNGDTGPIDANHVEDIIRSLKVLPDGPSILS